MEKKTEKRPYQRPVLKRIELRTEEVLSGGCKLGTAAGVGTVPTCISGCSNQGS